MSIKYNVNVSHIALLMAVLGGVVYWKTNKDKIITAVNPVDKDNLINTAFNDLTADETGLPIGAQLADWWYDLGK